MGAFNEKMKKRIAGWKKKGLSPAEIASKRQAYRERRESARNARAMEPVLGAENMAAATGVVNQFVKEGSFGRVDTGIQMNPDGTPKRDANGNPIRIQENADVLSRYKSIADKGLEAPEYQAYREQMTKGMDSNLRSSMEGLAKSQARGRVFGAAASAQQSNTLRADSENRNDIEQQLFLKGAEFKRGALGDYAGQLKGMQEAELGREKTNLGQVAAEKSAQLGAFFNTIGIGQGQALSKEQLDLAREAIKKGASVSF
jgi:hypothetical protein